MVDYELKKIIHSYIKEICHFSQMQVFATSYHQKNYFQTQIDERVNALIEDVFIQYAKKANDESLHPTEQEASGDREFTLEELSYYDGSDGRPAYVAVNAVVYDVSELPAWGGGTHFGMYAGNDLTSVFMGCHQGAMIRLENVPTVGTLIQE